MSEYRGRAADASSSGLECAENIVGTGKRTGSIRLVSLATVLALCVGLFSALVAPSTAGAQADELTQRQFDRLIEGVTAEDPVYGPEEGELELDPDSVSLAPADVELDDLVATATFQNPYAGSRQQFDYGIQFRSSQHQEQDPIPALPRPERRHLGNHRLRPERDRQRSSTTISMTAAAAKTPSPSTPRATSSTLRSTATTSAPPRSISTARAGSRSARPSSGTASRTARSPASPISLSGRSAVPASPAPPNRPPRPAPSRPTRARTTPASKDTGSKKPKGTTYESPSYGYTLTYDKTWTDIKSENTSTASISEPRTTSRAQSLRHRPGRVAGSLPRRLDQVYGTRSRTAAYTADITNAGERHDRPATAQAPSG